jgi:hypothetical protein
MFSSRIIKKTQAFNWLNNDENEKECSNSFFPDLFCRRQKKSPQLLLKYWFKVLHHDTTKKNRTDKDVSRGDIWPMIDI